MEEEKYTQIPTIKKAITYIVDKDGNEIEQQPTKVEAEAKECHSERSEESRRSFALLRMTPKP